VVATFLAGGDRDRAGGHGGDHLRPACMRDRAHSRSGVCGNDLSLRVTSRVRRL
jgi:hypothetical protein